MEKIGIGIIGSGEVGRYVARSVVATEQNITIRAIFDPDPQSIMAARQDFGDKFVEVQSVEELLAREEINWVMVAYWNKVDNCKGAQRVSLHISPVRRWCAV